MVSASPARADALIIGDGIIGLSIAYILAKAGAACVLVGRRSDAMASTAAAGLLMPDLDALASPVRPLFAESLAAYPAFIDDLRPFDPTLSIIQGLREITRETGTEGRYYPNDGAIDNVRLVRALGAAIRSTDIAVIDDDPVVEVDLSTSRPFATTRSGQRLAANRIILAAGAWAPQIAGLPRALPVRPLKGQMLAFASMAIQQPTVGDDVYLVPRGSEVLAGATVEEAGFDTSIDPTAIRALQHAAIRVCPALADAPISRTWAGIRPATPDMLPILGPDPNTPQLLYACGHSKNGILLAPITATSIAALALGLPSPVDLAPFSIARFTS